MNESELVVIDEPPPPRLKFICEYAPVVRNRIRIKYSFLIIFFSI